MAQLALEDVTKRYGSVVAIRDVTLAVGDSEFHCLLGPNGSGKTTIFRLLLGLTRPSSGTVRREDAVVGCGFQTPNFYPGLTVSENLDVFGSLVGAADDDWRETLVDRLRLSRARERRAGDLSGGFARKLDLALALLKRPDVLLLDEPLGALDDASKIRLLEFLADYAASGNAVVVSTHQVGRFEPLLDRVTVMHEGEVIVDGPPSDLDRGESGSVQESYLETVLARERAGDRDDPDGE